MTPRPPRYLSRDEIKADRKALLALKNIGDYAPTNPTHSLDALAALEEALEHAEQARLSAEKNLVAARDRAMTAALMLHDALLGVKAQVLAQYGPDSYEIESLGLKRRSERKRPARRTVSLS